MRRNTAHPSEQAQTDRHGSTHAIADFRLPICNYNRRFSYIIADFEWELLGICIYFFSLTLKNDFNELIHVFSSVAV